MGVSSLSLFLFMFLVCLLTMHILKSQPHRTIILFLQHVCDFLQKAKNNERVRS